MKKKLNILISGGGTGGHIFPAVAIAQAIEKLYSNVDILFVGAIGKMEMEKVPQAGYRIQGLPISGLQRQLSWRNFSFPFKLIKSLTKARKIIKNFNPDIAIGVGGYASGPVLFVASQMGVPCLIQEQNAFPGITNKLLAKRVQKICVAYDGMQKFFPANKLLLTGNPVRHQVTKIKGKREEAMAHFGLDNALPTVLIVGGSLGARSINRAVQQQLPQWQNASFQLLWQTGKLNYEEVQAQLAQSYTATNIHATAFISRMDLAYAAADLVISRAGAIAISELSLVGLPVVFVPYPFAAEDHQSKNAERLVEKSAAWMIPDHAVNKQLFDLVNRLMQSPDEREEKAKQILKTALPSAEIKIAKEALALAGAAAISSTKDTTVSSQKVFFMGIGGIGMSALARYYLLQGAEVYGYDKTPSDITHALVTEGAHIFYEDKVEALPTRDLPSADTLIIYTPAIPQNSVLKQYCLEKGYKLYKRAEILGKLSQALQCLAVAGTHGKTTTSTMLAHIMASSPIATNAFLGGISKNFRSNFVWQANAKYLITEADEYDRSFLHLHPHIALITAMDADHLDIYGDANNLQNTFKQFTQQVHKQGYVIVKKGLETHFNHPNIITYGVNDPTCAIYANQLQLQNGKYHFDIYHPKGCIKDIVLPMPGKINIENATAATAMAIYAGVSEQDIRRALNSFMGIDRRMDVVVETDRHIFIDDYAHHPQEVQVAIESVKELYPQHPLCVVFQPHLYSRTQDFAKAFAHSLEAADEIILLDIYPARELPIEGVNSQLILKYIQNTNKTIMSKDQLLTHIENQKPALLLTLGAGDINKIINNLKTILL